MTVTAPAPSVTRLAEQAARWVALNTTLLCAAPYAPDGVGGFPRGAMLADPALGDGFEYLGRAALWAGAMPPPVLRARRGVCVSFTLDVSPPAESGAGGCAARTIIVRVHAEAATPEEALMALTEVQRCLRLGPWGVRAFVYAPRVSAAVTFPGGLHGLIGVPPPDSVPPTGRDVWRVLAAHEYAAPQTLGPAFDDASVSAPGTPWAASGLAAAVMSVALDVVPCRMARPVPVITVTASPAEGGAAAIRVRPRRDPDWDTPEVELGSFNPGDGHAYTLPGLTSDSTLAQAASALDALGYACAGPEPEHADRTIGDLVPFDWRDAEGGVRLYLWGSEFNVADPGGDPGGAGGGIGGLG